MTPIMSRHEAAALVDSARIRQGRTWANLAEHLGTPLVWTAAALLGQHPLSTEQARSVCDLLGLDDTVAESLALQPSRGTPAEVMADPTIYRLTEAVSVYGPALKALIHEEFGDGIMSAINFRLDLGHTQHAGAEHVVITFDGKFLDYKW